MHVYKRQSVCWSLDGGWCLLDISCSCTCGARDRLHLRHRPSRRCRLLKCRSSWWSLLSPARSLRLCPATKKKTLRNNSAQWQQRSRGQAKTQFMRCGWPMVLFNNGSDIGILLFGSRALASSLFPFSYSYQASQCMCRYWHSKEIPSKFRSIHSQYRSCGRPPAVKSLMTHSRVGSFHDETGYIWLQLRQIKCLFGFFL